MADLILINAKVISLDPSIPEADLVFIKDGRIRSVSSSDKLKELRQKQTQVVNCNGRALIPGFCDAHFHLRASISNLVSIDLSARSKIRSIRQIQERIKAFSNTVPPGTWIRAAGYNEFYLDEKRHPTRRELDMAAPEHPVKLTHQSRHAHVLNSLALKHVGITRYSSEPPGGVIDRYTDDGEPNGVLFEMGKLLSTRIPPISADELNRGAGLLNDQLVACGVTSIHDASQDNHLAQWQLFCELKANGKFLPRISMAMGHKGFSASKRFPPYLDSDQLKMSGVKIIIDGTTGRLYPPQAEINRIVLAIHQAGRQAAIHAVEEAAVESACAAIEYALKKSPVSDHRHRIEHCSVCPPSLAKRLAASGVLVVSQPQFIYHNGGRYLKTVAAEKIPLLYPFGTLHRMGVLVAGGSDSPVVCHDPLIGIYAAVSRRAETGEYLCEQEAIDVSSALKMMTINAAKATFDEDKKGSLAPGKLADMVLLNSDPTTLSPDAMKHLKVSMTILNGEIVHVSGCS